MKKLNIYVLLVALLLSVASIRCSSGSDLLKTGSSLMSSLGKVPNLSSFTNLLQTPGLGNLLGGAMKKPFTLLAPTNDALSGAASGAMGDVSKIADMVKNLIIPGKKDAASLMQSGVTAASGKSLDLTGAKLGDMISGDKFNIIPVDKVPGQ